MSAQEIGARIRAIRQRRGISTHELAATMGAEGRQGWISRLERGLVPGMTVQTFLRIARVLGVRSWNELLGRPLDWRFDGDP